ncbi:MAG: ABC transporter permease [Bacteroidota bacterium]
MSILALFRLAARGFVRHRMRALLTTLGIVIGVGAFITMVAIGRGANARVSQQIASMGANMLVVQAGSTQQAGARGGSGTSSAALTDDDVEAIGRAVSSVKYVAPLVQTQGQVVFAGANWSTSITGTTAQYLEIRTWPVESGSVFTNQDVVTGAKVCLLGRTVVEQLFGDDDPIGQVLRVRTLSCQVVGVLAVKGQSQMGQDQDDVVLMPYTTVRRKLFNSSGPQGNAVNRILLSATGPDTTKVALAEVQALLRQRHRTAEGDPEDPQIRDLTEFGQMAEETTKTITTLLASIAAVSLLVGGIGIMNIMLVSVTERTREIGIRMAVGAKGGDILSQFLVEALVLTVVGGIMGMALGTVTARLLASAMEWPALLGWQSYALGFGFSAAVGVVFGFYPAWRASRMDPIEALRFE